jgi:hypothetical protein
MGEKKMSECNYLDDKTHECKLGHKIPPVGCGKDCEWFDPRIPGIPGPPRPPIIP